MKKQLIGLLAMALSVCAMETSAQIVPAPSSTQIISQNFGLGKITLTYARPNVKGRKIFGGLEPYGTVWRTGANNATVIKFSDEVIINNTKVPPGEYGLFSIPGETEWTVILSKKPQQWGAYTYSDKDDLLRLKVKTDKLKDLTETLTLDFINVTPTTCDLQMKWERSGFEFHIVTDIDAKVVAKIDSAMATAKKPLYDAIMYYYNNNKDMDKALAWATELESAPGMPAWASKMWKARIQLKKGDKAGAIATATAGIEAAKKDKNDEYIRLNSEIIAQAKK